MSTFRALRTTRVLTKRMTKRVMRYFAKGIIHIFSPSTDQYPKTGLQPFSGEPAKDHF